jgi:glycine cleavage system protein P-like pyridoxal-binding family
MSESTIINTNYLFVKFKYKINFIEGSKYMNEFVLSAKYFLKNDI